MTCPACSSPRSSDHPTIFGVYTCRKCQAVYGRCYLGDSYTIVKPWFAKEEPPAERCRYFDLDCLGSGGLTRRHGWYDPATGLITQVG